MNYFSEPLGTTAIIFNFTVKLSHWKKKKKKKHMAFNYRINFRIFFCTVDECTNVARK